MAKLKKELEASLKYLKRDKHLGAFIRSYGPLTFRRTHTRKPFQALCESIIYQQISNGAATSILNKFKALWPNKKFPTPEDVKKISIAKLHSAGLSGQKSSYLKDLAAKCIDGTISSRSFHRMSDEEVIEHLIAVKGIGRWTAQMFLMFTLGRADVLPIGDLGIQKGFQKLFGLKKLPSEKQMEKLSKSWAGHRTVACFYLWRFLDQK